MISAPMSGPVKPTSDSELLFEVVDGQIVELPPMGAYEVSLANLIQDIMSSHPAVRALGRAVVEMLFVLDREKRLKRRPDVAFVSYERWPRKRRVPRTEAWDVVPDLAVEVVSESNTAEEVLKKLREYFLAGVRRVWVYYPSEELVYDYTSPTKNAILARTDELDGGDVIPGFKLPIRAVYEEESEDSAT